MNIGLSLARAADKARDRRDQQVEKLVVLARAKNWTEVTKLVEEDFVWVETEEQKQRS